MGVLKKLKFLFISIFGDVIAKIYLSIIKPSIDKYITNSQTKLASIGLNTNFYGNGSIFHPEGLVVGNHSKIGYNFFFHAKGGIEIGDNTIISRNVTIYSANHNYLSEDLIPYDCSYIEKKVVIGNSVWIGMNASILPGVVINDGAIIGMGAIITKDVAKGEIVVSSHQRTVGCRDLELFNKLEKEIKFYGRKFD
jgi:maltose O-acetyltransferase